MPLTRCALVLALISVAAVALADDPEPVVVIDDTPLTAVGQHSPAISDNGGWCAFVKYSVRENGDLSQDLYVRSMDGNTERRITSSSLVYHPTWRGDIGRLICVAVPEKVTQERRPGLYQLDPSGEAEPIMLAAFARGDIPFAPTVAPDDMHLAYIHYTNDPARRGELAVFVYNLDTQRLTGELPAPTDGFRISERSGPWWQTPRHLRVLGERVTDKGIEVGIYECDGNGGQWRRVHVLKESPSAGSVTFSHIGGRMAFLRDSPQSDLQEVVVADKDGKKPTVIYTISRPYKHLVRPFANDIAWTPDGRGLIVTSGANLVLLRLGKPGEGSSDASKENMLRLYDALMQYAYDHAGELPHWDHNREAYGVPGRDPFYWITALGSTYLPAAEQLYCALDTRDRDRFPSSYQFNARIAGNIFDNEAQKQEVILLEETDVWHDEGRLVLYTDGSFDVIPPEE